MVSERRKPLSSTSAAIFAIAAMAFGGGSGANAEISVSGPIVVAAAPKSKQHHKMTTTETTTSTSAALAIQLYEDPATGQLFTRPGAGRRALAVPAAVLGAAAASTAEIDSQITQKAQAAAQAEVAKYAETAGCDQRRDFISDSGDATGVA